MIKIIFVVAFAACVFAAPVDKPNDQSPGVLTRPAPINPLVLGDPKPEDKLTIAADKDDRTSPKHKRDNEELKRPLPIQTPSTSVHDAIEQKERKQNQPSSHIHTRDTNERPVPSTLPVQIPTYQSSGPVLSPLPAFPDHQENPSNAPHSVHRRDTPATKPDNKVSTPAPSAPSTKPAANRRPYQPQSQAQRQPPVQPQPIPAIHKRESTWQQDSTTTTSTQSPSPGQVAATNPHKRDIPVPLTEDPKPKSTKKPDSHDDSHEDTTKTDKDHKRGVPAPGSDDPKPNKDKKHDDDSHEDTTTTKTAKLSKRETDTTTKPELSSTEHPATVVRPVPVSQIFGNTKPADSPNFGH